MTLQETSAVLDILKMAYPAFYGKQTNTERVNACKLWASLFEGEDLTIVAAAVKALIATKADGFPPSIGEVKEQIYQLQSVGDTTEAEAWAIVSRAVSNCDLQNPGKTFAKLPPDIQAAVGSANVLRDWGLTDTEAYNTVIMSAFLKNYRTRKKRQREMQMIPENVRVMLKGVADKLALPQSGGKDREF